MAGTIWIAVNGIVDRKPKRLPLKQVSDNNRSFLTMSFNGEQRLQGEIRLPENFTPRNLIIEVKPNGKELEEISEIIDWPQGG